MTVSSFAMSLQPSVLFIPFWSVTLISLADPPDGVKTSPACPLLFTFPSQMIFIEPTPGTGAVATAGAVAVAGTAAAGAGDAAGCCAAARPHTIITPRTPTIVRIETSTVTWPEEWPTG